MFKKLQSLDEIVVKSSSHKKWGPMAQLGARLNGIEEVVGSSPTRSIGLMREPAERLALLARKNIHHRDTKKNFVNLVPLLW